MHYKERERRLWKKWSPVRLKVSRLIAIWKSDIMAKGLKKIGEDMKKAKIYQNKFDNEYNKNVNEPDISVNYISVCVKNLRRYRDRPC